MKTLTTILLQGSQSGSGRTDPIASRSAAVSAAAEHSSRNTSTIPESAITRAHYSPEGVMRRFGQEKCNTLALSLLSHKVAAVEAENQIIEEIQILALGGPDESRAGRQ
jgi:hypothetical protein